MLTTNYWPRGITRELAGVYKRVLAPSRNLLHAFKQGEMGWEAYRQHYLTEVSRPEAQEEITALAVLAESTVVTVMCVCKDESQCHRSLLRTVIQERLTRPS